MDDAYADWDYNRSLPPYVLNDFVQKTTGTQDLLFQDTSFSGLAGEGCDLSDLGNGQFSYTKENSGDEASLKLTMDITDGQTRYIYYRAGNCDSLKVSRNDSVKTYSDTRGHLVELGNEGHIELEFVTDSDHSSGTVELYMFTYDPQVFEEFYNTVSRNTWGDP